MPYCVVKSCKNNNISKSSPGLSFHKFPRDPVLRDQWTQIIRQTKNNDNWTPSDFCVVCSEHFESVDLYCARTGLHRLRKDAIPTKNIFSNRLGPNVISVKIENGSSDSEDDEPLQRAKQKAEGFSNTQANRKLVIFFDTTDDTKKEERSHSIAPISTSSSNSAQNISNVFEHDADPLSINNNSRSERHTSQTPRPNISIISIQHEPDFAKDRDVERQKKKKKGNNNKKKEKHNKKKATNNMVEKVEVRAVEYHTKVPVCPKIDKLEKELKRLQTIRLNYKRKLKTLHQLTRRLKRRNASLKSTIKDLMGGTSLRKSDFDPSEITIEDDDDDDEDIEDDDDDDKNIGDDDDDELLNDISLSP
ncbi:hypothetical protein O0L34_g12194 [Tuta absoluta]|nr:hypothetical protein O0L34_g12194 [Tuta absoluta]